MTINIERTLSTLLTYRCRVGRVSPVVLVYTRVYMYVLRAWTLATLRSTQVLNITWYPMHVNQPNHGLDGTSNVSKQSIYVCNTVCTYRVCHQCAKQGSKVKYGIQNVMLHHHQHTKKDHLYPSSETASIPAFRLVVTLIKTRIRLGTRGATARMAI